VACRHHKLAHLSCRNDLLYLRFSANIHIPKQTEVHPMKMTIPYNITGKQWKQLAEDIIMALHTIPKYQGYPTCAYKIGDCILERDGKLIIPERVDDDTATELLAYLKSRGYLGEAVETEDRLTVSPCQRNCSQMPALPSCGRLSLPKHHCCKKPFLRTA